MFFNKFFLLLCSFCVILFTSCATTKYINPTFKAKEISKIGILSSVVKVGIIKVKNEMDYDSLTFKESKSNISQNINTVLGDRLEKLEITEDSLTWICKNELLNIINFYLANGANQEQRNLKIQKYIISSRLDSLMKRQQLDFLTFSIHEGFKRTKENYANQNMKGLGVGLLTLGMVVPTPIQQRSFFVTILLDRKKKNISYINYSSKEINPLNLNTTYTQFCNLFNGVFTFENNGQCYHNQLKSKLKYFYKNVTKSQLTRLNSEF